jgi:hypothetical protein
LVAWLMAERHANLALLSLVGSINPRGVNTGVNKAPPQTGWPLAGGGPTLKISYSLSLFLLA